MLNLILEMLKDLVPHKDLPTGAWIGRIITITLIFFIFIYCGFRLIEDTEIAKKYGLIKVNRKSSLSHVGFTRLIRKTRTELRKLIGAKPSVKTAIVITTFDPYSGHFTIKSADTDRYIIWEFAAPQNLFLSITNLEIYLQGANKELSDFATNECVVKILSTNTQEILSKNTSLNDIDSWLKCPVIPKNSEEAMAYTILFFNSEQLKQNGFSNQELTSETWKLNETISDAYEYFSTVLADTK